MEEQVLVQMQENKLLRYVSGINQRSLRNHTETTKESFRDHSKSQLGLIGGTMDLLTGFSLLSGVEIIYYVVRFFLALRISRANLVAAARNKFENHLMKKSDLK